MSEETEAFEQPEEWTAEDQAQQYETFMAHALVKLSDVWGWEASREEVMDWLDGMIFFAPSVMLEMATEYGFSWIYEVLIDENYVPLDELTFVAEDEGALAKLGNAVGDNVVGFTDSSGQSIDYLLQVRKLLIAEDGRFARERPEDAARLRARLEALPTWSRLIEPATELLQDVPISRTALADLAVLAEMGVVMSASQHSLAHAAVVNSDSPEELRAAWESMKLHPEVLGENHMLGWAFEGNATTPSDVMVEISAKYGPFLRLDLSRRGDEDKNARG